MLHVAFVIIATACLFAGWWQVHRAMQGNTLSYLYSVEWPAFAVVAGIGWWQMFHDTPEDLAERKAHHGRMKAAGAEVVARTLPRSARALTVGSAEREGRASRFDLVRGLRSNRRGGPGPGPRWTARTDIEEDPGRLVISLSKSGTSRRFCYRTTPARGQPTR